MLSAGGFTRWGLRVRASKQAIQQISLYNQQRVTRRTFVPMRGTQTNPQSFSSIRSRVKSPTTQFTVLNLPQSTKPKSRLAKVLSLKRVLSSGKWLFIQKKHTGFFKTKSAIFPKNFKTSYSIFTKNELTTRLDVSNVLGKPKGETSKHVKVTKYTHRVVQNTVFDSMQPLHLYSRIGKPFILNSSLMFFTKMIFKTKNKPFNYKYMFKKKLFSFLYPNEVRNALLYKKKQFVFYKLIFDKNKKLNNSDFYSTRKLKKLFNYHNFQNNISNQYNFFSNTSLLKNADPSTTRMTPKSSNFAYFTHEISEVEGREDFKLRGTNNSFKIAEVKIPRIQFKPGYQRL